MKRKRFYMSRNGGVRRYNSYSVGYSEALQRGLIADTVSNRKRFGEKMDLVAPVEWHHGLRGVHVNFWNLSDLL